MLNLFARSRTGTSAGTRRTLPAPASINTSTNKIMKWSNKQTNLSSNSFSFSTKLLNKQIKNKQYLNLTTQIQQQIRNIQTNEPAAEPEPEPAAEVHNEQVTKINQFSMKSEQQSNRTSGADVDVDWIRPAHET
jgi:hypothetical protein